MPAVNASIFFSQIFYAFGSIKIGRKSLDALKIMQGWNSSVNEF